MEKSYSNIPHVLGLNRIKRAYTGGKLLDIWQGLENPTDANFPEEFLCSTVEVTNEDKKPGEGLSKTILPSGEEVALKDLISRDYAGMLGEKYKDKKDVCVSARIGDPTIRIVLQCHPDTDFSRKYLNFPNGKAEAWYVLETREINGQKPNVYIGFKKGVTREMWYDLFLKQDIKGMLDCMHELDLHKGDALFVPPGMPHAVGGGSMFIEIHEPCDYTMRLEKDYLPNRKFSDNELHYGLGNDLLMDSFHYDTYTEEEIRKICVLSGSELFSEKDAKITEIVSYAQAERFKVDKCEFEGEVELPKFDGHRVAVAIEGDCEFVAGGSGQIAKQGRAVFLPANATSVKLKGSEGVKTTVLVCYPPQD